MASEAFRVAFFHPSDAVLWGNAFTAWLDQGGDPHRVQRDNADARQQAGGVRNQAALHRVHPSNNDPTQRAQPESLHERRLFYIIGVIVGALFVINLLQ